MLKILFALFLFCGNITYCFTSEELVEHVKKSVQQADMQTSQLPQDILTIEGLSGHKVRHLLNNLCALQGNNYLEIGVWKGSTFISALFNNQHTINKSYAIDNWLFNSKSHFFYNIESYLPNFPFIFYNDDCFKIDVTKAFDQKIDIYFYDGEHTFLDHVKAFLYYNEIFADHFIAVVDDYNWPEVQKGTQQAFDELGYTIIFEQHLSPDYNGSREGWRDGAFDTFGWWNGIYIAVVSKK